ncbi:MAG: TolB family protein [Blastocatellia bacterium]
MTNGFGDNFSEFLGLDWLPDGSLVYGSNTSGNSDIWRMDISGSDQRLLTTDGSSDMTPHASADGRSIYYVSYTAGNPHIWRMDADGANARQVTTGSGESSPSLTPDGQWLVYQARNKERLVVWKMPVAGGDPVQLTDEESRSPVVSPDGQWVGCFMLDRPARIMRLTVAPLAGGPPRFVCRGNLSPDYNAIQWTADSRFLTFIVTRDGISNIWGQPVGGAPARQLTDFRSDRIFRFAWSPDGKNLACERGATINDIVMVTNFAAKP